MIGMTTTPSVPLPVTSDRAVAIDLVACAAVSIAICVASDRLLAMSVFVPLVLAARFVIWRSLAADEGVASPRAEAAFLGVCTVLGAANDWNSVVRHHIYDYDVPVYFPELGSIPLWMLLYWGLIVRSMATLSGWTRLSPLRASDDTVRLPWGWRESALMKVAIEVLLVVGTRQCIYRWYLDPLWSWLPFALAIGLYVMLFPRRRGELVLGGIVLVGGPAIEVLYIHVGRLHHYHLGWLGGVPLWIALWWVLAVWVWSDIAPRLLRYLDATLSAQNADVAQDPCRIGEDTYEDSRCCEDWK